MKDQNWHIAWRVKICELEKRYICSRSRVIQSSWHIKSMKIVELEELTWKILQRWHRQCRPDKIGDTGHHLHFHLVPKI